MLGKEQGMSQFKHYIVCARCKLPVPESKPYKVDFPDLKNKTTQELLDIVREGIQNIKNSWNPAKCYYCNNEEFDLVVPTLRSIDYIHVTFLLKGKPNV